MSFVNCQNNKIIKNITTIDDAILEIKNLSPLFSHLHPKNKNIKYNSEYILLFCKNKHPHLYKFIECINYTVTCPTCNLTGILAKIHKKLEKNTGNKFGVLTDCYLPLQENNLINIRLNKKQTIYYSYDLNLTVIYQKINKKHYMFNTKLIYIYSSNINKFMYMNLMNKYDEKTKKAICKIKMTKLKNVKKPIAITDECLDYCGF